MSVRFILQRFNTHKLAHSLRFLRPFPRIHLLLRPASGTTTTWKTMPKVGYYAVRVGKKIGVYNTWEECQNQTEGYPNARYKRFSSQKAAEDFAYGTISTPLPSKSNTSGTKGKKSVHAKIEDESCWDVVYSDGACKGNGRAGSVAGVGVWWGHEDQRNIAERCPGDQTNNRAELIAILWVLETTPLSKRPLLIKTDSEYSINCFDKWIGNWMKKGWKTSNGKPVKNEGIIRCISSHLEIRSRSGQKVRLQHVKGHSGEVGNEGADYLANEGTLKPPVEECDWKAMEARLVKVLDSISPNTALVVQGSVDPVESSPLPKTRKSGEVGDLSHHHQSDSVPTGTSDLESNSSAFCLPRMVIQASGTRSAVAEQDRLGRLDKLSSSPSKSNSPSTPTKPRTADETEFWVSSVHMPSGLPRLIGNAKKQAVPVLEPQELEWTKLDPPLNSNVSSQQPTYPSDVFSKADQSLRAHNPASKFLAGSSRQAQDFYADPSTESPVRVLYAAPPLVPVRVEDVNFEDYADCLVDDADLALGLSD